MQAFSRTNRIYNATKTFGNIVTFRDLEAATIEAIRTFGDSSTRNVVLEKSYKEYLKVLRILLQVKHAEVYRSRKGTERKVPESGSNSYRER